MNLDNSALLFLDFQFDVCAKGGKMISQSDEVLASFQQARARAASVLEAVRAAARAPLIVHVAHVFEPGYPELDGGRESPMDSYVRSAGAFVAGTQGAEIVPELQPRQGEYFIRKHTLSPFASTDLTWWLTKRGVGTILLAGVVTHYAILSTAISGYDLGFNVVILGDCCASGVAETHEMALQILKPLSSITDSAEFLKHLN